jgi:hypothetical protein
MFTKTFWKIVMWFAFVFIIIILAATGNLTIGGKDYKTNQVQPKTITNKEKDSHLFDGLFESTSTPNTIVQNPIPVTDKPLENQGILTNY